MPETCRRRRPISRASGPVPNRLRDTRCGAGCPRSQTGTSTRCISCTLTRRRCSRLAGLSRAWRGQPARQAGSRLSFGVRPPGLHEGTTMGEAMRDPQDRWVAAGAAAIPFVVALVVPRLVHLPTAIRLPLTLLEVGALLVFGVGLYWTSSSGSSAINLRRFPRVLPCSTVLSPTSARPATHMCWWWSRP
jgi:hypothetical protein